MVIHEFTIPYKSMSDVIRIKVIPDVHWGNTYCDKKAFKQFIGDKEAYYISIGDLFDAIVPSDQKRFEFHTADVKSDDAMDWYVDELSLLLKPIAEAGRIIGLGCGNHEKSYLKHHGSHLTRRLCKNLNCKHLGRSWFVRLIISPQGKKEKLRGGRTRTLIIKGHHGWGGGSRTQGGDLTKFAKDMANWDADIFLYGHVHRLQDDYVVRWGLSGMKSIVKPKLMGICGTFLKTFSTDDLSTYSEDSGYPPTMIGGHTLNIKITDRWAKYWFSREY